MGLQQRTSCQDFAKTLPRLSQDFCKIITYYNYGLKPPSSGIWVAQKCDIPPPGENPRPSPLDVAQRAHPGAPVSSEAGWNQ